MGKTAPLDEGCRCQNCGKIYATDILVPDAVWEQIKPKGSAIGCGLLCPTCTMNRAADFCGWTVGFAYRDRHGPDVIAGKAGSDHLSATVLPDGLDVVAWEVHFQGHPLISNLSTVAEQYRADGQPVEELVRASQAQSALAAMRVEIDRLNDECRLSMQTIADERERAEAAESQVQRLTEENEGMRGEGAKERGAAVLELADEIDLTRDLKARIKALEEAGNSLSNTVYNLAQLSSPLTDEQKASMRQWVDAWDAATLNSREKADG